jgi:hypothetical protein
MSFLAQRQELIKRDIGHCRAEGFQPLNGLAAAQATDRFFRDQPGNGSSVPSNDDGVTPLNIIEELGKMDFRFGGLDFAHDIN